MYFKKYAPRHATQQQLVLHRGGLSVRHTIDKVTGIVPSLQPEAGRYFKVTGDAKSKANTGIILVNQVPSPVLKVRSPSA